MHVSREGKVTETIIAAVIRSCKGHDTRRVMGGVGVSYVVYHQEKLLNKLV